LEDNNWNEKSAQCRKLILANYKNFCDLLNSKPICPVTSEFLGQMCSIPIKTDRPLELKEILFNKYKIEIPITKIESGMFLRIALNAYNSQNDLDILYAAIVNIKRTTDLLK
jgi:isopenicillin-N epimerase